MKQVLLLALILTSVILLASDKQREWRTGKLLTADKQHWVSHSGSSTTGQIDANGNLHANTSESTWGHNTYSVAIDDGEYIYICERTLSLRWQHDPRFTENADVKWALEKDTVYVIDDTGREFKMKLQKRRKKTPDVNAPVK
jgi:hypothetical protein